MHDSRLLPVLMVLAGVTASGHEVPRVDPPARPRLVSSGYSVFWGDLHAHTAYSNDAYDLGNTTLEPRDAITYARDVANLDFVAITDHAEFTDYDNAHYGNFGTEWQNVKAQCDAANTASFVAFIGFEFTKASPGHVARRACVVVTDLGRGRTGDAPDHEHGGDRLHRRDPGQF